MCEWWSWKFGDVWKEKQATGPHGRVWRTWAAAAPEKGDAMIRTVFWAFDLGIHVENGLGGGGKLEVGSQWGGESHGGLSCPVAARREGETPSVKTGSGQDGVCRRE